MHVLIKGKHHYAACSTYMYMYCTVMNIIHVHVCVLVINSQNSLDDVHDTVLRSKTVPYFYLVHIRGSSVAQNVNHNIHTHFYSCS